MSFSGGVWKDSGGGVGRGQGSTIPSPPAGLLHGSDESLTPEPVFWPWPECLPPLCPASRRIPSQS